ncbi:Pyruvate/Phosphoenolpyruvate kinase-like domain-containing protein [Diplogelasinospora grovesii]|uniref:Pyruvate/Phosphoenolpyruvate kinase-like domain-containing protein n=1 Tax=Diplogelasinospora grovesii TaxID=303347 RepID=A0AAN6N4K7_9PEZI|nr:Pyruvate/Phosphoenolpyruvate kinase-like domain-containing protein [Diplogelasinospora grovesii]
MSGKSYLEQPDLHTKAEHRAALLTYPGNLRAALRQAKEDPKKTLFGVAHGIPSVFVTKVLASAKPDFIWIDVEHGIFDRSTLYDAIHAAQHHSEGKSLVIVRVPKHDEISLTTALDAGASGIVIPHTESAQDVKDKIREIYYPPIGQRSFSPWTFTPGISDASLYPNDSFNMRNSNNHICIIPQIESVEGVENLDEIAAVEGVTGLMFGPGDFSADAGIEFRMDAEPHPTFVAAMTKMVTTAHKYGLPLFGGAMDQKMIPMMVKQGYAAIAVTFDVWGLANLIHGGIQQARASVQQEEAEPKA